ncbi:MAG: diaminopimelate epimerase [Proteobacteria bacterium]|nr:diaminopimelate epimerase [Pseudomonadota bacterium]
MHIDFTKMHGAGNDFVIFDLPAGDSRVTPEWLRRLADRRTGIGFDQALALEPARRADTAVYYRIFNADGDEVEQCGNGARCVAALLHQRGRSAGGELTLDSPAGLVRARIGAAGRVAVDMGVPDFEPAALPFLAAAAADSYLLETGSDSVEISAVSMGNPHAVLRVADVDAAPVATLGAQIGQHARFPRRVNVGFMQIVDRGSIRLRVYERGAGETLACGTGACAAVAVGRRRGWLDAEVRVQMRGGELSVNWPGPREHLWLTGPTETSFTGQVEVQTS